MYPGCLPIEGLIIDKSFAPTFPLSNARISWRFSPFSNKQQPIDSQIYPFVNWRIENAPDPSFDHVRPGLKIFPTFLKKAFGQFLILAPSFSQSMTYSLPPAQRRYAPPLLHGNHLPGAFSPLCASKFIFPIGTSYHKRKYESLSPVLVPEAGIAISDIYFPVSKPAQLLRRKLSCRGFLILC